jgi:putative transposase
MIMSFVLTFSPPDTETALEAVRLAMLPKDDFPVEAPDLGRRWPAHGRPTEIHVDNGKPYNSSLFIESVEQMGLIHQTMPLLKAWFKAVVERAIGTTMQQVFHTIPGTTYSNVYDRDSGDIAPEKVAEATLEDAQQMLLTWLLDEYLTRIHRGLGEPVINAWSRSIVEHEQRLPLSREDIEVATIHLTPGKLQRGGIIVNDLLYLTAHGLEMEMAAKSKTDRDIVVRRSPGDLTTISFLDARVTDRSKEVWHTATICTADRIKITGLTLEEFRLARALRKQRPEDYGDNDPFWGKTNQKVAEQYEIDRNSDRSSRRVLAEGQRESIRKQTEHRIRRTQAIATGGTGEDLQAQIEDALLPETPIDEATPAPPDDDEAEMQRIRNAHKVGLRHTGEKK